MKEINDNAIISDFFSFINERHQIYVRRFILNEYKPWTTDKILRSFRFTNVFRQLDKGTLALNNMVVKCVSQEEILFNVMWYRLFNWFEHASYGPFLNSNDLDIYFKSIPKGTKTFTSAHMTSGSGAKGGKKDHYLKVIRQYNIDNLTKIIFDSHSMEFGFNELRKLELIGPFIAYEMVCDLRFLWPDWLPYDKLTWANVGPGAARGLARMQFTPEISNMVGLYKVAPEYLSNLVVRHYPMKRHGSVRLNWPPFELREIEHSLCEFDKYRRVLKGEGRPRQNYDGGK